MATFVKDKGRGVVGMRARKASMVKTNRYGSDMIRIKGYPIIPTEDNDNNFEDLLKQISIDVKFLKRQIQILNGRVMQLEHDNTELINLIKEIKEGENKDG